MGSVGRLKVLLRRFTVFGGVLIGCLSLSVLPLNAASEASARLEIQVTVISSVHGNSGAVINALSLGGGTGGAVTYNLSLNPPTLTPSQSTVSSESPVEDEDVVDTPESTGTQQSVVETVTVVER